MRKTTGSVCLVFTATPLILAGVQRGYCGSICLRRLRIALRASKLRLIV
ncbi:MAG: hypothetical protein LBT48_06985 [Prevotellaceae bacterium]|nr:hypothetical protein [Prevotellaceae bacterium]